METVDKWIVDWKYVAEELAKEITEKDQRIAELRIENARLKVRARVNDVHEAETRRGSHVRAKRAAG